MSVRNHIVVAAAVAVLAAGPVSAQSSLYFYPAKGQTAAQQVSDQRDCEDWAYEQTGFNPNSSRYSANYSGNDGAGDVVRGAAGGALLGVIGGAIAGDVGTGAAIGAAVGGTTGLIRGAQRSERNSQARRNANAAYQADLRDYERAIGACMRGRGYTVE